MSYENKDKTEHDAYHKLIPNLSCELCWDVNAPESRVKSIPIPKGFVSAPRRGDGHLY